ncbi:MAG: dockerin type I repeat-containing protein [Muribaculaceae bacterium]|nr:dockerin type I repeat-containing protein [Muribaculaceae bacterium]
MRKSILLLLIMMAAFSVKAENKPYITKIYDFMPAPGQFINNIPYVEEPVSKDSILTLVAECICGYEKANGKVVVADAMISLGSFGGYVVFGFDHPVVNIKGEYDLQIFGNAMQSNQRPLLGGSSESGIVMVSRDVNGNGIPDDPWYELAGSEYNHPKTQKNFTITYYKPDDSQFGPLGMNQYHDQYIRWTSNSVDSIQEGYVRKNSFHSQSYWPSWVEGETLTFEGTKLRGNAQNFSATADDWHQYFFDWGYVDNRPDDWHGYKNNATNIAAEELNQGFKLDWAVDDEGNPVDLKKIDFVKVYCAMLQDCGWIGEESTEVCGAIDLHPDAVAEPEAVPGDVNRDGNVTSADVTALYNYLLNGDETYLATSDVNGDGNITSADVTFIYNILLGD